MATKVSRYLFRKPLVHGTFFVLKLFGYSNSQKCLKTTKYALKDQERFTKKMY